ncbi:MAG: nucleotidyltransferase domain-containing protein [Cyclobacteriaceae bacterium]
MSVEQEILSGIKKSIKLSAPKATVILYGSYARGDQRPDSDIDLLILIDKEKVSIDDERKIKYPLYDIEFDKGKVISPLVLSKREWETKHSITPFYENIKKEGIRL